MKIISSIKFNTLTKLQNHQKTRVSFLNSYQQDIFEKSDSTIQKEQKRIELLKSKGVDKFSAQEFSRLDDNLFNRILQALDFYLEPGELHEILKFSDKDFEIYLSKRQEVGSFEYTRSMTSLDKKTLQKINILMQKGMEADEAKKVAQLDEENFQKMLKLLQYRIMHFSGVYKNDTQFNRIIELLEAGIEKTQVFYFSGLKEEKYAKLRQVLPFCQNTTCLSNYIYLSDENFKTALQLLKEGLDIPAIPAIVENSFCARKYASLSKKYNNKTASRLAVIERANEKNADLFATILDKIDTQNEKSKYDISSILSRFITDIEYNSGFDMEEFCEYLDEIDLKEAYSLAPEIKEYNPREMLEFYYEHYKQNHGTITKENLEFKDFENHLKTNLVDSKKLRTILCAYPLTKKEIGEIPSDWLDKTKENKEAISEKIYQIISDFQASRDEEKFMDDLSELLSKKVKMERLPAGAFGKCYRIKIENAMDCCLKLFHNSDEYISRHGVSFEPQAGFFACNNSDKFVKMHFGKVAKMGKNDGFIVTQYLNDSITPIETGCKNSKFNINCHDACGRHNMIKDKIIDFGDIEADKIYDHNWLKMIF